MQRPTHRYAGMELGGTKVRCAVSDVAGEVLAQTRIATEDPASTLGAALDFFRAQGSLTALGIASFGPLQTDTRLPGHGVLLDTPKLHWQGTDLLELGGALGIPVVLDTDVNAAALAEWHQYCGGQETLCYVTVGTGIGGGICVAGRHSGGSQHGEFGHIFIAPASGDEGFNGICPFHERCLEGMASGPAIAARYRRPASALGADHEAWDREAHYLAQLCVALLRIVVPDRIVLGGGVMAHAGLLELVRTETERLLGGYHLPASATLRDIIMAPKLGNDSGLLGALQLARRDLER